MKILSLHLILLLVCFSSAIIAIIPTNEKMESSIFQVLGNTSNAVSFAQFARKYEKKYESIEEMNHRFSIFSKSLERIKSTNNKNLSYTVGLNEFSDWSWEEIKQYRLGLKVDDDFSTNLMGNYTPTGVAVPPDGNRDWRKEGIVSRVKDQGRCGSCWAFSVVGAVESAYRQAYHKEVEFSEQQLLECSRSFGNRGCKTGAMGKAYQYLLVAGGISTEKAYPYTGRKMGSCKFSPEMAVAVLRGYVRLPRNNEDALKQVVGNLRPVSVGIVVNDDFHDYTNGIFQSKYCGDPKKRVNHSLLLVGYGVESGIPYWIAKNSWGDDWGEEGYIRIRMGRNMCKISRFAIFPSVQ